MWALNMALRTYWDDRKTFNAIARRGMESVSRQHCAVPVSISLRSRPYFDVLWMAECTDQGHNRGGMVDGVVEGEFRERSSLPMVFALHIGPARCLWHFAWATPTLPLVA